MKCKICEKEFELKKEEKYLATEKVAAFGTLAKLPKTFEAFDCPYCGCQNIVNIREEEATKSEVRMGLIDADKLIEKLRDFKEWENDDGRPIHTMSEIQRIDRCINFVQMEPTAYNVDAVISELNKESCIARPVGWSKKKEIVELKNAIEIVKRGGEDE